MSVDIDHYSIDKDNIFMIAKSVESVSTPDTGDDSETKKEVYYTVIKIFKEQEVNIREKLKSKTTLDKNFTISDNASYSSKLQSQKSDENTSQNSKSKRGGEEDRSS